MRLSSRSLPRVLVALPVLAVAACNFFGPDQHTFWVCLNPVTGKEDGAIYDSNNVANGQPDPCHCYDACGPSKECPIYVDAGPPGTGCDAGGDGGW